MTTEAELDNGGYSPEQELEALKMRADRLGVKYHPSISAEKLREKIATYLAETEPKMPAAPVPEKSDADKLNDERRDAINRAMRLVRVRITCMNPFKKEWEGEIFTAGNSVVGSVEKYVPFNTEWHVPQIMLNMLEERNCQIFFNEKARNGITVRRGKLIKEFAIEILPDLTPGQLKDLAQQQAMANRI